jgi:uncharacterized membrane protein
VLQQRGWKNPPPGAISEPSCKSGEGKVLVRIRSSAAASADAAWSSSRGAGTDASQGAAFRLAALMAVAGTLHFVQPSFFDRIIPPMLPGRARTYTHAFGVAAYALSAALVYPRTRRVGATMTAAFYVAVVPAKVQLTVNWLSDENAGTAKKTMAILHLPWQVPLVTEALKARRNAAPGSSR